MSLDPYAEIQRLVATLPESRDAVIKKAHEWSTSGFADMSLELLRRARARDASPSLRLELSRMLHKMGRTREGLGEAVAVVKEDANNLEGLMLLAELLGHVGERDRATKMLDRARALGAPESRVLRAQQAAFSGGVADADRTEPGASPSSSTAPRQSAVAARFEDSPPRKRTLLGLPSQDGQRRALPRISEGGFAALDAYQTMGGNPDESLLHEVPAAITDGVFDDFLSQMGVPVSASSQPVFGAQHVAEPEDPTTGFVISDELVGPSDETAAIQLPDHALSGRTIEYSGASDATTMRPSVEVQPDLVYAQPDIDNMPTWDVHGQRASNSPGFDAVAGRGGNLDRMDVLSQAGRTPQPAERPAERPVEYAPERPVERKSSHERPSSAAVPAVSGVLPAASVGPRQFDLPPDVGARLSAMPQANQAGKEGPTVNNRTVLAVFGLAALVFLAVAVLGASGVSETGDAEELLETAKTQQETDTYQGYRDALVSLDKASNTKGFLGISIPGARGPKLRKQAAAEEAFLAARLEYEFGESLTPSAAARLGDVGAQEPAALAANGLLKLKAGDVGAALEVAVRGRQEFPGNPYFEELDVLAHVAAGDVEGATRAVAAMRGGDSPGVRQRFLPLLVDAQRDERKAIDGLKALIAEHPAHAQARVAVSRLLDDSEAENAEARKTLLELVDGSLKAELSPLDLARASIALGDVLSRSGELERAEDRYRDAVRTLSTRWDLYVPLLKYYLKTARLDEVKQYLEKAKGAGVSSPALTILEAQYLLRVSEVEQAVQRLMVLPPGTPERDWWLGVGYFDLQRPVDAAAAFARVASRDPAAAAAEQWMRALAGEAKFDDAGYGIGKIAEEHPTSVDVAWVQAAAALGAVRAAESREKRQKLHKQAVSTLEAAIGVSPDNERLHFLKCEVHLLERDGAAAEKACLAGRKVNSMFAPGALLMARLRRLQGHYKEAREIIEAGSRQRPEDVRFGLERARISLEFHDLAAAEAEINRWLGKDVAEFELNLLEGRLAFQRGEYSKAAAYLQNAQAVPQGDGEATVFFGITLARLGRHEEAGPLLLDSLPHPTWSGWGWLYLGELRRLQGRYDDAFDNFPKALREFKGQTGPRWRYSTLYAEWARTFAGRFGWDHPRVTASLETGRDEGDPDDPELNAAFAEYFLKRKKSDTEAAIRHLNKVVQVASYRCDALGQLVSLPGIDDRRRTELKELQSIKCQ